MSFRCSIAMILTQFVHKGIDEVATSCFLGRPLLFAGKLYWKGGDEIVEVGVAGVVARILAASSLYSFTNLGALSRSLILYH